MKPRMFLMILCLACLVACPASAAEDKPRGSANYLVKIEFDPNVLPLDLQLANRLLGTSPIWPQAVKDAGLPSVPAPPSFLELDVPAPPASRADLSRYGMPRTPPVEGPRRPTVRPSPAGPLTPRTYRPAVAPTRRRTAPTGIRRPWANALLAELLVCSHAGGSDADAERLAAALCKRLEEVLLDAHRKWLDRAELRRAALKEHLAPAEKTLAALHQARQELWKKTGVSELSYDGAYTHALLWEAEKRSGQMEAGANAAEIAAYQEQIARIGKLAAERVKKDEVAAELAAIVQYRQHQVQLLETLRKQGHVSSTEGLAARESLAKAKVDLLKRREEVAASAGGNQLAQMNRELTELALRGASYRAKLLALGSNLDDYRKRDVLAQATRYDELAWQIARAERTRKELLGELESLDEHIRSVRVRRPAVTIIGQTPEAKPKKK